MSQNLQTKKCIPSFFSYFSFTHSPLAQWNLELLCCFVSCVFSWVCLHAIAIVCYLYQTHSLTRKFFVCDASIFSFLLYVWIFSTLNSNKVNPVHFENSSEEELFRCCFYFCLAQTQDPQPPAWLLVHFELHATMIRRTMPNLNVSNFATADWWRRWMEIGSGVELGGEAVSKF